MIVIKNEIPKELLETEYKIFAVDTSAVMNYPDEIKEFIKHCNKVGKYVVVLSPVFKELDDINKRGGEKGYLARLGRDNLIEVKDLESFVYLDTSSYVRRNKKNDMSICLNEPNLPKYMVWSGKRFMKDGKEDVDEMLKYLAYEYPVCVITNDKRIINDIGMRKYGDEKGDAVYFELGNHVDYKGYEVVNDGDFYKYEDKLGYLKDKFKKVYPNEIFFVGDEIYVHEKKTLKRIDEEMIRYFSPKFKLRNEEQKAAMYLLMNPEVKLLYLYGPAGTGKTLLSVLSGLIQWDNKNNPGQMKRYDNFEIFIGIHPVDNDIGYLPGGVGKKMEPWAEKIKDNIKVIKKLNKSNGKYFSKFDNMVKEIKISPITYTRGRSITNTFIIVEEAQNLAPHTIKTVITRVGENSKIVILGDPNQIDNRYLSKRNNGLMVSMRRLMGKDPKEFSPIMGVMYLSKNERSEVSKLAAERL